MRQAWYIIVAIFLLACNSVKKQDELPAKRAFSTEGKKVIVYTTADSADYKLKATDTLSFVTVDQPIQRQQAVFVDPSHTFQTFIGIGGALYFPGRKHGNTFLQPWRHN